MTFLRVAAYAPQGVTALGLGTVGAVFGARPGLPAFDLSLCTDEPGPVRTDLGVPVRIEHGLDALADSELVVVLPSSQYRGAEDSEVATALRAATARGATLAAHCTGVFLLAAAGLLDGLEVTTHWQFVDELTATYPRIRIRPEALYVDQGTIVTGAGATAGLDLYLHLVRRDHGAATANDIARALVTPPHRHGDQAQYIPVPVTPTGHDHRLAETMAWAARNLAQPITIDHLATRTMMSRRTFARRFKSQTGTTPKAWLLERRFILAEELLETTDLPIDEIARRVGYSTTAVFREQFALRRNTSPRDYRRTFTHRTPPNA